jgi:predicted amino acid racemase
MIRVTIDLIPYGIEEKKKNIDTITISNIYTSIKDIAEYSVRFDNNEKTSFMIKNHRRIEGIYSLLKKVIDKVVLNEIRRLSKD